MNRTSVVCILKNNKVLLVQRSATTQWRPLEWSLVGGLVERNEAPERAAIREVREETGIKLLSCGHGTSDRIDRYPAIYICLR